MCFKTQRLRCMHRHVQSSTRLPDCAVMRSAFSETGKGATLVVSTIAPQNNIACEI